MKWESFSKRLARQESAGQKDVYQYDVLPEALRVQIAHIWRTTIGVFFVPSDFQFNMRPSPSNNLWTELHDTIAREHGTFSLGEGRNPAEKCMDYLLNADTPRTLDLIEYSFRIVDIFVRQFDQSSRQRAGIAQDADDAIAELNDRFQEHGVGYQYSDGILIRLDSQFAHAEIVKPALQVLNGDGFEGPSDEFIRAFDHYRHGRNKEAVADALKALESTAKAICAARKWVHPPNATAKPLIDTLFQNGLIPPLLEGHFSGLRAALESGLPTLANKTSRHGQGTAPVNIPPHIAAYALHLVAANIVFMVQAHRALK